MRTLYEVEDIFSFANDYPKAKAYIVEKVMYQEGKYTVKYRVVQVYNKVKTGSMQFEEAKGGKRLTVESILKVGNTYRVEDSEGNPVNIKGSNVTLFICLGGKRIEDVQQDIMHALTQQEIGQAFKRIVKERAEEVMQYMKRATKRGFKYEDYGLVTTELYGMKVGMFTVPKNKLGIKKVYITFIGYIVEKETGLMEICMDREMSKVEIVTRLNTLTGNTLSKEFLKEYIKITDLRRSLQK